MRYLARWVVCVLVTAVSLPALASDDELAQQIAARAPIAIQSAKEAINAVFDMDLDAGVAYERRLFYSLFATEDQKEGMDAFVNKRLANWKGK